MEPLSPISFSAATTLFISKLFTDGVLRLLYFNLRAENPLFYNCLKLLVLWIKVGNLKIQQNREFVKMSDISRAARSQVPDYKAMKLFNKPAEIFTNCFCKIFLRFLRFAHVEYVSVRL
jgi:hypothetical protein